MPSESVIILSCTAAGGGWREPGRANKRGEKEREGDEWQERMHAVREEKGRARQQCKCNGVEGGGVGGKEAAGAGDKR